MAKNRSLVLIEWDDSRQPTSNWYFLSEFAEHTVVKCRSVGWLVEDGQDVLVLASNLGDVDDPEYMQATGVIRIPQRAVTGRTVLSEEGETHDG